MASLYMYQVCDDTLPGPMTFEVRLD